MNEQRQGKLRKARLFPSWQQDGVSEIVIWHCFGEVRDENGSYMAAIVEMADGKVQVVSAGRLQFMEPPEEKIAK